MTNEFDTMQAAPVLTLDPLPEEKQMLQPAAQKEEVLDETILSQEEQAQVDAFARQIDLTNSAVILQYGAGTQKKMADFSDNALENVKTKD